MDLTSSIFTTRVSPFFRTPFKVEFSKDILENVNVEPSLRITLYWLTLEISSWFQSLFNKYLLEAVQFTIAEVGSDLIPTETTFQVTHKGRSETVRSRIGILLTSDYARSRGFDVATLRARGLIRDRSTNRVHPGLGRGEHGPRD